MMVTMGVAPPPGIVPEAIACPGPGCPLTLRAYGITCRTCGQPAWVHDSRKLEVWDCPMPRCDPGGHVLIRTSSLGGLGNGQAAR